MSLTYFMHSSWFDGNIQTKYCLIVWNICIVELYVYKMYLLILSQPIEFSWVLQIYSDNCNCKQNAG